MITLNEWIGIAGVVVIPLGIHYSANKDFMKKLFFDRIEKIEDNQEDHGRRINVTEAKIQVHDSKLENVGADLNEIKHTCERRHITRGGV